jgi:hypothetical protein
MLFKMFIFVKKTFYIMFYGAALCTHYNKSIYASRHVNSNFLKIKITLEANAFHIVRLKNKQGIWLFWIHKIRDFQSKVRIVRSFTKGAPGPCRPFSGL